MNDYAIHITANSKVSKVEQLTTALSKAIAHQQIKQGQQLLSISCLAKQLSISRDTVEKSYKRLRDMGCIESVPNRGYFVIEPQTIDQSQARDTMQEWITELRQIGDILKEIANTVLKET